jgi:N6-L-threonylcarbamoyladenine synthase
LLLASGGHSQILIARGVGGYEMLGETLDDSAGEAFDKVAKMLGLGYPGGPVVEKRAGGGNPAAFDFPRPLCGQKNCDFSFSGIKTAARTFLSRHEAGGGKPDDRFVSDFCASFQQSVIDVVTNRLENAIARAPGVETLVVAGGVAANGAIRAAMEKLAAMHGMSFAAPPLALCTDNGAMIAWAGIENFRIGNTVREPVRPRPRWPLQNND